MQGINEQAKQGSIEWAALPQPHRRGFALPIEAGDPRNQHVHVIQSIVQHPASGIAHPAVELGTIAVAIAPDHEQTAGAQKKAFQGVLRRLCLSMICFRTNA